MISKIRTHLLALALAVLGSAAQAGVVESRFGPTDGLGITREVIGGHILYRLG